MTQPNSFNPDIGGRVLVVFLDDTARWQTLDGIARASGLTSGEVTRFIEDHRECFVESSISLGGTVLYGLRQDLRQRVVGAAPIN